MALTSLFTAVSGISSFGNALSVTGNNIANLSTVGFKSSKATFADLVTGSLGGAGAGNQIGRGVFTGAILNNFTQGALSTSANGLDLAVDGNGFFLVRDNSGAAFYTRAGQFRMDASGRLVDPSGSFLQGYQASNAGALSGTVSTITLTNAVSSPQPSTTAGITANLNAAATVPTGAFSTTDPTTYNFATSLTTYDSLGASHSLTLYFRKTGAGAWDMHHRLDGLTGTTSGGSATNPVALTFDSAGVLLTPATAPVFNYTAAQVGNNAAAMAVTMTLSGITQFGSPNAVSGVTQNGFAAGALASTTIDTSGVITGRFTNGQVRTIAQIALSRFPSPDNLSRNGRNLLLETASSGQPTTTAANTGGVGRVLSGSLELSNVDLGEEFIDMISAQRGFQANSRVITTTDELLQELVNLRR
jgi:flagellar hook protein FlgE